MSPDRGAAAVSVLVPVRERPGDLARLYLEYSREFEDAGRSFEFIFATEPATRPLAGALEPLIGGGAPIRTLELGQSVGESALLTAAAAAAAHPVLVTLPAYPRVKPGTLEALARRVEDGADLVNAVRVSSRASWLNQVQRAGFHALLGRVGGRRFRDVASGVNAMQRSVLGALPLYGDLFRFLPYLAAREGFDVVEHEAAQDPADERRRIYSPQTYLRRVIDLMGVAFLVRFTQKPLRFFGLVGSVMAIPGAVIMLAVLVQRLGGKPLAERPLLLLGTLLFVMGVQSIAVGLIGEVIVYLGGGGRVSYRVRTPRAAVDRPPEAMKP